MTNDNSSNLVIVAYKPKPGKADELLALVKAHHPGLLQLGLVTARAPVIAQAGDGTVIEVFEWLSDDAIKQAHSNPAIHKMWGEFAAVCEYVPLASLTETAGMFAGFKALN